MPGPTLDSSITDNRGYVLGRMFAIFERLQRQAHGKSVNASITDRLYSAASTTPRTVFVRLERLSKAHLHKLRATNGGAAVNRERELDRHGALLPALGGIPTRLDIEEQAWFALGYHHQRQDYFVTRPESGEQDSNSPDVQSGE